MDVIARECGIQKEDVVFELGCGRGRTCFWLNTFIGCKVVGIGFGNNTKVAIVFQRDEKFEDMLKRWHNKEFIVKDVKGRY